MGKAVTNEGGTGNTLVNNKFDDSDDIQALDTRLTAVAGEIDNMDYAKYYGKYSQMSGGVELTGSAQSGIVTFSKEDNDDFSAINLGASNSRITIPQGVTKVKFYWSGSLSPHTYSPNSNYIYLYKNGVQLQSLAYAGEDWAGWDKAVGRHDSVPITCKAGDYFELYAQLSTDNRSATLSQGSIFGMEVLG
jgi:hypothetical protein